VEFFYNARDRCYDVLKYFRQKILWKNWRFWLKTKLNYAKILFGFCEKRQFSRRKLAKISENCDHNIGPRSGELKYGITMSVALLSLSGVDVMITILCDFANFRFKKLAFFSKTNFGAIFCKKN
jgi:hypothetical protein